MDKICSGCGYNNGFVKIENSSILDGFFIKAGDDLVMVEFEMCPCCHNIRAIDTPEIINIVIKIGKE